MQNTKCMALCDSSYKRYNKRSAKDGLKWASMLGHIIIVRACYRPIKQVTYFTLSVKTI